MKPAAAGGTVDEAEDDRRGAPRRASDELFDALERSAFRRRFHLGDREREYVTSRTLPVVLEHARDFIARRLAPPLPANDGKQTPYRGHPVFVAQHATATCCRGCLAKWHGIPRGEALSDVEQSYVRSVIERWLRRELREDEVQRAR